MFAILSTEGQFDQNITLQSSYSNKTVQRTKPVIQSICNHHHVGLKITCRRPTNQLPLPAACNCSWWLLLNAICAVLMINAHIIKTKCALNVSSILQIKYLCIVIFLFKRMAKLLMTSEIKAQNTDLNGSVASKCSPKSNSSLIWSSQAFQEGVRLGYLKLAQWS